MLAPTTFQQVIAGLAAVPDDGVRGLRFCFGREVDSQAGALVSWPRFARRIHSVAQRLLDAGVQGGDVIAVHVHDQQLALLTMLAAMHLGAIPTALAPLGPAPPVAWSNNSTPSWRWRSRACWCSIASSTPWSPRMHRRCQRP